MKESKRAVTITQFAHFCVNTLGQHFSGKHFNARYRQFQKRINRCYGE